MLKTPQEIKDRIEFVAQDDWMGTQRSDLIDYLPFADAKEFLKPEVTEEKWAARPIKSPMEEIAAYLPFAWGKANDCRGLSAGRSLDHIKAWLWLSGYGVIVDRHFQSYTHYGKFQLVIASAICGFDFAAVDDGRWVSDEDGPSLPGVAREKLIAEALQIAKAAAEVRELAAA